MIDGKLINSIATERVTRNKYDGSFISSVETILERNSLQLTEIDTVLLCGFGKHIDEKKEEIDIYRQIKNIFSRNTEIIYYPSHHEVHAWCGLAENSEANSLIAVIDNSGSILKYDSNSTNLEHASVEQTSYYFWDGEKLELVARDHNDFEDLGYGRFYSKVTRYIGFDSYHDAGKTMGLAPIHLESSMFPNPYIEKDNREVTELSHIKQDIEGLQDLSYWFNKQGINIPQPFSGNKFSSYQARLAKWAQETIEQSIIRRIKKLKENYDFERIIMIGGVALNSVLNEAIENQLELPVIIPSSPGDSGLSIGLLAKYNFTKYGKTKLAGYSAYLGFEYTDDEVVNVLSKYEEQLEYHNSNEVIQDTARLLNSNKIVSWYQGRSEFGPRALGNRSILANPSNPWMKEIINNEIKCREWFRPFAPSILKEKLSEYFTSFSNDFDYMMKTAQTKKDKASLIPSVIHNDYSARVQTVTKENCPLYYQLIHAFYELSGLPIVLNTSFNLGGMPLVESPEDAVNCFLSSDYIDVLVIHDYIIQKKLVNYAS
ncbi:hypothetical protein RU98_GL000164 [Enterococcus caccae]|nr:hypothetical protein RU98_GL000164 [Enterococcus caccae]